jgi:chromosome partitioning protein
MPAKITVASQRGGVAKTTTAANVAEITASTGLSTLLIDADPQGSIATILGLTPKHYLYDFLIGGVVFEDVLCSPVRTCTSCARTERLHRPRPF